MIKKYLSFASAVILLFLSVLPQSVRASNLPDFITLAKEVRPAVVNISVDIKQERSPQSMFEDLFRRRFGEKAPNDGRNNFTPPAHALGSGFIISADGYIITNRHVVNKAEKITVRLADRREFVAKVVGSDAGTDVALLKIDANDLPVVKTGSSSDLQAGQWVLAIGAPFGFDHTVTAGIVSAKRRQLGREQYVPFIQTDVAINPGNSGGPLVDLEGRVVGINSQIWTRSGGYMGISFAIPVELAMNIADQLRKTGKVARGYLGVTYQDVDYNLAKSFGLKAVHGALLPQVSEGSPAAKAGLKAGDIVLSINGKRVERAADLPFIIGQTRPGDKARMKIIRDGKRKNITVIVGDRPAGANAALTGDGTALSNRLGLGVKNLTSAQRDAVGENGVLVTRLEDGPAADAGIRRGDVIISINKVRISSAKAFRKQVKALEAGKAVPVLIVRPQVGRRFLVVRVPK